MGSAGSVLASPSGHGAPASPVLKPLPPVNPPLGDMSEGARTPRACLTLPGESQRMAAAREISSLHPRFRSWFHPTLGILLCVVNSLSCGRRLSDPRLVAAREALAKREIGRAEDLASEMLRDQPDSGAAMDIKGLVIQAKGGDAEPVFREAIRLSPKLPDPRDHLAGFLYQRGRAAEAEKLWQEIVGVAPEYAPAHYNLGSAQQAAGQLEQAVAQFREALRIDPSLIPARINLGIAL